MCYYEAGRIKERRDIIATTAYDPFNLAMYTSKTAFTTPTIHPANPKAPWKSSMYSFHSPAVMPLITIMNIFTMPIANQFGPSLICMPHPSLMDPENAPK